MRVSTLCLLIAALFAAKATADKFHDDALALLADLDDKEHPVLPELAKAPPDLQRDVYRNVAQEANDCLSYYYSVGYCVKNTNATPPPGYDVATGTDILQLLKKDRLNMYGLTFAMTEAGGLDRSTISATVDNQIVNNALIMHNDCGNISLITKNTKTLSCKTLAKYPAERMRYWLKLLRK